MDIFNTILYIIGIAWIANLISWAFEPLQKIRVHYSNLHILWCAKCVGLWLGILATIVLLAFPKLSQLGILSKILLPFVISYISGLIENNMKI